MVEITGVEEIRTNGKLECVRILLSDGRVVFTNGYSLELCTDGMADVRIKL